MQLGLKASAATWPHNGEMVQGFVSAFPSMAWLAVSKAQEPTCFLAVRCWGVWVKKNVKVLTQLLREAANETWSSTCLRSEPANSRGKPVILHQSLQVQKADFLSLCFSRSKMLLLQVKNSNDKMVSLPQLDFAVIKKREVTLLEF